MGAESTGSLNTQVVSVGHPVKGNLSRDLIGWGESQVAGWEEHPGQRVQSRGRREQVQLLGVSCFPSQLQA